MLRLIAILSTACIVSNGCSSKRSKPPADFPEDNGAKSESSAVGSGETTTAASKTTVPKNARLIVLNWQPSPQLTRRLSEHDTMFGTLAIETPSDAPTLRLRVKVERLSAECHRMGKSTTALCRPSVHRWHAPHRSENFVQ